MVDRVDLLIAVIGIVVSVVGSSTALWVALAKKADKDDLGRFEARLEASIGRLESRVEIDMTRIETKLDGLMIRLLPDGRP